MECQRKKKHHKRKERGFPDGPVAKTMFPVQGAWAGSLVRELDPTHVPQLKDSALQLRPGEAK